MAFDIYDREAGKFFSWRERNRRLEGSGIPTVRQIAEITLSGREEQERMSRRRLMRSWEEVSRGMFCATFGNHSPPIMAHFDMPILETILLFKYWGRNGLGTRLLKQYCTGIC